MESWKLAAFFAAVLYGLHNIFTKLASGRISDQFGGFVLESTAAILILGYIVFAWLKGEHPVQYTKIGLLFSVFAGMSVAVGTILYFIVFRLGGHLSIAGPLILVGGSLFMILAGIVFLHEKISFQTALGLLFGMVSLYLLSSGKG